MAAAFTLFIHYHYLLLLLIVLLLSDTIFILLLLVITYWSRLMFLIWVHGRHGEQALGFMGILSKRNKYNQGGMLTALISIWIVPAGNESGTYTHNTTATAPRTLRWSYLFIPPTSMAVRQNE